MIDLHSMHSRVEAVLDCVPYDVAAFARAACVVFVLDRERPVFRMEFRPCDHCPESAELRRIVVLWPGKDPATLDQRIAAEIARLWLHEQAPDMVTDPDELAAAWLEGKGLNGPSPGDPSIEGPP